MPYGRRKQMNEDIAIINELTQQMLKQYLEADADQNDSACEHRPPLELFSDGLADTLTEHCAEEGQQEGDDAYGAEGKEQLRLQPCICIEFQRRNRRKPSFRQ